LETGLNNLYLPVVNAPVTATFDGGKRIIVTASYARFVYRVERTRAVFPRDVEVKRPVGYDQLIVSASHPPYSARQRLVVFARLVRAEAPGILYEPAAPRRSR